MDAGPVMDGFAVKQRHAMATRGKRAKTRRSAFTRAVSTVPSALCLTAGLILVAWLWPILDAVPTRIDEPVRRDPTIVLLAADGKPFAEFGPHRQPPVTRDDLPDHFIDALLSIEDRRYYQHFGIDPFGMLRAGLRNARAGQIVEGGSTITQQLAKIDFLGGEQSFERKIREVILALRLEAAYSKDEILLRYLNHAYFGGGTIGLAAASDRYFGKKPRALGVRESAVLAGLIRAPSLLNPQASVERATERADVVLAAMVDAGKLSPQAADAARREPLSIRSAGSDPDPGVWFAQWAVSTLRYEGKEDMSVRTTFDPRLQSIADTAVRGAFAGARAKGAGVSQVALVAMRRDGAVLSMVGGLDPGKTQFNRAYQARRQPGSAFKLFVYLAGLRLGYRPDDVVMDMPVNIDGWSPKNYNGRYYGYISLSEAFARSVNTIAARLGNAVGASAIILAARDLGIDADLNAVGSLALGTSGVTLLDLTGAYASVAAGVMAVEPYGIETHSTAESRPRLDHRGELLEMLRMVVDQGTGRRAALNQPVAGKTGTSQSYRDAWFVGFAGDLVVGVWVGNDDETPMHGITGGSLPAQISHDFMEKALPLMPAAPTVAQSGPAAAETAGGFFVEETGKADNGFFEVADQPLFFREQRGAD
ncbi:transglycosylase domain-containing protein [Microbaculum marinisediminis]|uniref:transglycosylase domain-containing protein n=1 Tax=Microbaculum marinisediminis TaxID=2931392 RepID=UPI0021BFDCA3|nr:transglycosylase domain-containing protein [Microbaculum sp. A6E488]